jgi:hypothetical protein
MKTRHAQEWIFNGIHEPFSGAPCCNRPVQPCRNGACDEDTRPKNLHPGPSRRLQVGPGTYLMLTRHDFPPRGAEWRLPHNSARPASWVDRFRTYSTAPPAAIQSFKPPRL